MTMCRKTSPIRSNASNPSMWMNNDVWPGQQTDRDSITLFCRKVPESVLDQGSKVGISSFYGTGDIALKVWRNEGRDGNEILDPSIAYAGTQAKLQSW